MNYNFQPRWRIQRTTTQLFLRKLARPHDYAVVAIELLDGVAVGLFSVISVVIAADLTRGTGRFNLAQGLVALSVGIGAGLSNLTAGFVVQSFSYRIRFLYLAGIAICGLMFFATMMPETRPLYFDSMTIKRRGRAMLSTATIAAMRIAPCRVPSEAVLA